MSLRTKRVGELLRDIISDTLRRKVSDPRIGMVSIVRVDVTGDLKNAFVYISLLSDDSEAEEKTLAGLNSATRYIQNQAGKELSIKTMPQIEWRITRGIPYSIHIQNVIDKIHDKPPVENDT